MKELYEMKCGEGCQYDNNNKNIHRVPGGWIYELRDGPTNKVTSCFVPYSDEFNTQNKPNVPKPQGAIIDSSSTPEAVAETNAHESAESMIEAIKDLTEDWFCSEQNHSIACSIIGKINKAVNPDE